MAKVRTLAAQQVRDDALTAALKIVTTASEAAAALAATATETATRLAATTAATTASLNTHEAVCSERYSGIRADIKSLKSIILWGGGLAVSAVGVLIMALAIISWAFIKKELKL